MLKENVYTHNIIYRKACAIPDLITDSVIITGGYFTEPLVARYDRMGWVEDLPQLIEGRYNHGCGSYLRVSGTQVSIDSVVYSCECVCTGGLVPYQI